MNLEKYIPVSGDVLHIADARTIGAGRAILKAAEIRRDERREINERNPVMSDDIKKDIRFNLGYIAALNWILELPDKANKTINALPQGVKK